ncbi:sigma-54-dependent Fis family transcriptional regulator [Desulfovirgula thermocuniculi]|uniref:sigma-54-dependent Fis family transcriptional regulator n=1 Tax=Desulfovirgula thermocuniculi TaxID=348842 RepID=UPI00055531BF|nr:sigma-54-dependent Fis family transcriptional regulator [Desulfovirgula thermocuniculi]
MRKDLYCLFPTDTLARAISLFRRSKIDTLPVVDEKERLCGVFTRSALYDALLCGASLEEKIAPYIIKNPVTVPADLPYAELTQMVRESTVGTAPVLDRENRVVGILTKQDMVLAALRQADLLNAQLKATLDAMHNGLIAVDSKERITLINAGAERIFRIKAADCLGRPLSSVFPGLDLKSVLHQKSPRVGFKYLFGSTVTVVNAAPINHGSSQGAVAVFQDITELEQIAQELESVRELNETLNTVLNIIYDGLVVVDREGRITLTNRPFRELVQRQNEDLLGRHITEILPTSRLHIVARTGVPEISDIQNIGGRPFIVTRLPIVKDGTVVGAVGKITFPKLEEIQELARRLSSLRSQVAYYQEQSTRPGTARYTFECIITRNTKMLALLEEAKRIAPTLSTVLIRGESGTGKELLAHAIHMASPRSNGPFVKINCAAIPEGLLESELFGYAPGAFTGAHKNGKPGRFEMAHGGTIFLDEIGDMPLALQAKLLRVLQDREFERIGGTKTIRVDVRIIAATNRNLEEMVSRGAFREDLYWRLNVITFKIPPLRERPEDIEPLVAAFIEKYNRILKTDVKGISPQALDILRRHTWPGNVRELENAIERAANFAWEGYIEPHHLPPHLLGIAQGSAHPSSTEKLPASSSPYREKLAGAEREIIKAALAAAGGNKAKAARLLNISRSRLYEKMKKLNIPY